MVSRKIRVAITVFVILAFLVGMMICTVDAKTTASKSKGKTASYGMKSIKSKTPSLSVKFSSDKTATSRATLGNALSVPVLGIKDFSGFNIKSTADKDTNLKVSVPLTVFDSAPAIAAPDGIGTTGTTDPSIKSVARQSAGPTATGNALSVPQIFTSEKSKHSDERTVGGLAYSSALSTDFYRASTFDVVPTGVIL
jgi:hypothetical protein